MKPVTHPLFIAAIAGFLAGCVVMFFILPRETAFAKKTSSSEPSSRIAGKPSQTKDAGKEQKAGGSQTQPVAVVRGGEARQVLAKIKRRDATSISLSPYILGDDGKLLLAPQFIYLFELSPAESAMLSDLLQKGRAELLAAEKAQAQVTQTDTGGIMIKIPPIDSGPDIYDKVMNGFRNVLGNARYQDMMLFNNDHPFDGLFHQFGAEIRTVTIEKADDNLYKFVDARAGADGSKHSTYYTQPLDYIKKDNPDLVDFLPTE